MNRLFGLIFTVIWLWRYHQHKAAPKRRWERLMARFYRDPHGWVALDRQVQKLQSRR